MPAYGVILHHVVGRSDIKKTRRDKAVRNGLMDESIIMIHYNMGKRGRYVRKGRNAKTHGLKPKLWERKKTKSAPSMCQIRKVSSKVQGITGEPDTCPRPLSLLVQPECAVTRPRPNEPP